METDMTSRALNLIAAAALACVAGTAAAQASSSVTFYGTIDEYAGYFRSSSGTSLKGLYDGAFLRTRWGFRGRPGRRPDGQVPVGRWHQRRHRHLG